MRTIKLGCLFLFRALGLFRLSFHLNRRRLRILCYHGFELQDESSFRSKLFIKSSTFERRLKTLGRYGFNVLDLDDAVEALYAGTLPDNALVITIDDGFHSFNRLAVPILKRYAFPSTIYVTTYYVEHAKPIFRLAVQYMFWKSSKSQIVLENIPWTEIPVIDLTDPRQAENAMWDCIKYGEALSGEEQRSAVMKQLGRLLDIPYDDIVQSKILNLMTPDELRALASANVRIELHTHRHRFSRDDRIQAEREISDNRTAFNKWHMGNKHHFCYPSGSWGKKQAAWLDDMGIKSSTTCISGLNDANTPRHALKRFLDGENIHQLEFEAALCGITDLLKNLGRTPVN